MMPGRRKLYVPTCKGRQVLKVIFVCSLVSSLLLCVACRPAPSPEAYFKRAQNAAQQLERNTDEMIRLEAAGELDLKNRPEQVKVAEGDLEALVDNLTRAADGGHTLATYALASLYDNPMFTKESHQKACGLYQKAMDQGLLAAAVGYYHLCDKAYERFELRNADHLKYLQALEQMLHKPDAHVDAYPLPAKHSHCFIKVVEPQPELGVLAAAKARGAGLALTDDQFRAEANYILALTHVDQNDRPDSRNIAYLDKAEALGCSDFYGLSAMLREAVPTGTRP